MATRRYRLHCYTASRPSGVVNAVCLRPNLVVEGRSAADARRRLHELIGAYLEDAAADGTLDQLMFRRAPVRFYLEFWRGYLTSWFTGTFRAFTEVHPPQHA